MKIFLVLCMVACTIGCAASRQTKTPTFAKASAEETTTVKQDVIAIKIMSDDMTLIHQQVFHQPTTVTRSACPPQSEFTDPKMVECISWSNDRGWMVIHIHSDWMVAYTFVGTISELASN